MNAEPKMLTSGELIEFLRHFPSDTKIHFEELSFYRLKQRGEKLVQIEFNEPVVNSSRTQVTFQKMVD